MKKQPLLCMLLLMFVGLLINTHAETIPTIKWQKSFGGSGGDAMASSIETPDGSFILGGFIEVGERTNSVPPFAVDMYLVKLDASGKKQWDRFYGGDGEDTLTALQQTFDGGYILGGRSTSGISGDKSTPSRGDDDLWIIKLDDNFNVEWDRSFGGTNKDWLVSLQQTSDGGYVLGGLTHGSGPNDYWVIKLDSRGSTQWNKRFGGDGWDALSSLKQTWDGGYILAGSSGSGISGNKTSPSLGGSRDAWVVKLDKDGFVEWDKAYGGGTMDVFDSVEQTPDGGYILSGAKGEYPDNVTWVVKLDSAGTLQWEKLYGPADSNFGLRRIGNLQGTGDGGYILVNLQPQEGFFSFYNDCRILKMNSDGDEQWRTTFGGDQDEVMVNFCQTSDGSLMVAGFSQSGISGDKTSPNRGDWDGWVLKLESRYFIDTSATSLTNGSIELDPPQPIDGYESGTAVTLTATPTGTNIFYGWTGAANGTSNQITVTINGDIAMTGHFSDSLLLWQHNDGRLSTWFMNDTNRMGALILNNGQPLSKWRLVAANHFNDDASKDLLVQDAQGRLAVRYMDGNHLSTNVTPAAEVIGTSGLNWKAVGAGDFNSDSRPDLLFNNSSNQLAVRLMDGTNYTTSLLNSGTAVGLDWRAVTVCDFDSNGQADILFQHSDGRIAVWFMNGVELETAESVKRNSSVVHVGSSWRLVGATRINADDQSDLLFQHTDGRVAVWFMDGINHTSSAPLNEGQPVKWRLQALK